MSDSIHVADGAAMVRGLRFSVAGVMVVALAA